MYIIEKDTVLTKENVLKIIQNFHTLKRPQLVKYKNYFDGKQEILNKQIADTSKPCNRIVTNYCKNIVANYQGYICGVPITYSSIEEDITDLQNIFNYNDIVNADSSFLGDALTYGVAYEICYVDEDVKTRFKTLNPVECIPVYDNTLNQNLMYVIRYYEVDDVLTDTKSYAIEVYDSEKVTYYTSDNFFGSIKFKNVLPHYFKQVPITVFKLNADETAIFDSIITLQDCYNKLLSAETDDFEAFCDAYLVLKGISADNEDIADMRKNRVIILDAADADVEYLNKSISDTQIENMLRNINDAIHKMSASPDFNDEKLLAQSGIAMKYKLVGFENQSAAIEANMRKALQKRIELICAILDLVSDVAIWQNIQIKFTRNLPANDLEAAQIVNTIRGVASTKTLLNYLPFVTDAEAELNALLEENKANANLYSFEG